MKIHSISTHPCADVRVGEDLQFTNTPGVSAENSVAARSSTIEVNGDQFENIKKRTQKQTQNVSILLVWDKPSVREQQH